MLSQKMGVILTVGKDQFFFFFFWWMVFPLKINHRIIKVGEEL